MKIVENSCLFVVAAVIAAVILIVASYLLMPPSSDLSWQQEKAFWLNGLAEFLFGK